MDTPNHKPSTDPPEPPQEADLDHVILRLSNLVNGHRVIVGEGIWCGFEGYVHTGVVTADEDDAGFMCWEGYLPESDLSVLRNRVCEFADVRSGAIDFYHATRWSYAWTEPSSDFLLVDQKGIRAKVTEDTLIVHRRLGVEFRLNRSDIRQISVRNSMAWTRFTIVVATDEDEFTLVSTWSLEPIFDPLYDGIDLLTDTLWLESLAESLGESLDVPVSLPAR